MCTGILGQKLDQYPALRVLYYELNTEINWYDEMFGRVNKISLTSVCIVVWYNGFNAKILIWDW